jgi:hypothetical protein
VCTECHDACKMCTLPLKQELKRAVEEEDSDDGEEKKKKKKRKTEKGKEKVAEEGDEDEEDDNMYVDDDEAEVGSCRGWGVRRRRQRSRGRRWGVEEGSGGVEKGSGGIEEQGNIATRLGGSPYIGGDVGRGDGGGEGVP